MSIDPSKKWTHPLPLWVSRKDADGVIANISVPMWLFMYIWASIIINAMVWGAIGLWVAVRVVIELL